MQNFYSMLRHFSACVKMLNQQSNLLSNCRNFYIWHLFTYSSQARLTKDPLYLLCCHRCVIPAVELVSKISLIGDHGENSLDWQLDIIIS